MIWDRLRRFRNIERARPPGSEAPPAEVPERFRRVEGPGGPEGEPAVPGSATDRFRPPLQRPLEVAEPDEGQQPFRRCVRCEADSARFADVCQNCGADLRTPEQEAFNDRLWARRRAEAADEARANAERAAERDRLAAEEKRARQALAAEMARMEAGRVRGELDRARGRERWGRWRGCEPDPGSLGDAPPRAPLGLRLLRAIRSPVLRVAAILAAVALPAALIAAGRSGGGLRVAGMVLVAILLGLVTPSRYGWRRRRWWGW